jgi:tetratricopeptide (TPR) repeat protein
VVLCHALGQLLVEQEPPRWAEAVEWYRAARALRPELGLNLADALLRSGRDAEGLGLFQQMVEQTPDNPFFHLARGNALYDKRDLGGAIACYRRALDLDPRYAQAHCNLGNALHNKGDREGAVAAYHRAIAIDPKLALAHYNLGIALKARGLLDDAIREYRRAIELDPKLAKAHCNLGNALYDKGDLEGAVAASRRAIAIDPKLTEAHYNLGNALKAQGDVASAVAAYHRAITIAPKLAEAHCNLGHALQEQGHFRAALEALQRGHQLGSSQPRWRDRAYPSADWVRHCQRLADLEGRLPAILQGDDRPRGAAERLTLAQLCRRYKQLYATSARFYAEAFADRPPLAEDLGAGHRYHAACAAALAATGQGKDAARLDDKERARLRRQALEWLRADLAAWTRAVEKGPPQAGPQVQSTLRHWQEDPDLAGLRDPEALAQLPEAGRAACRLLWADVDALLKRATPKPSQP